MNSINWKDEFHRLMKLFESESINSLREIKRYFKITGHPFDENFRKYFLKMSTNSLDASFDAVLFELLNESEMNPSQQKLEPEIDENEIGNGIANTPESASSDQTEKHANLLNSGGSIEIFESNDGRDQMQTSSVNDDTIARTSNLIVSAKTSNCDEKGGPNAEHEMGMIDFPLVEFDLNKGNDSYNTVENDATDQNNPTAAKSCAIVVTTHPGKATKCQTKQLIPQQVHQLQQHEAKRSRYSDVVIVQPASSTSKLLRASTENPFNSTMGVDAWKQWNHEKRVQFKKICMQSQSLKTDPLQLNASELNESLCQFVKEVRKPNGNEYAPDTIYYLVLGIQMYLNGNGRIDNIFTDPHYERFTNCLDEVAEKFSVLHNDLQYIVTRFEEDHLWECKQLGVHSPHAVLNTLIYFNTKYFKLTTVEQHMQLSFSCVKLAMKLVGNSNELDKKVVLRFYSTQSSHSDVSLKKKKVYEQQANEANPLKYHVELYEFYLSKCPESVKTRNDVFYMMPEETCASDSSIWYSTQVMTTEAVSKALNRIKMVKEINMALWTKQAN